MKGFVYLMVVFLTVSANAETNQAPLYRIFLGQGDDLVSYGEYVRVDDRVVFSLPLCSNGSLLPYLMNSFTHPPGLFIGDLSFI
mgnify:CR=1 FL=1